MGINFIDGTIDNFQHEMGQHQVCPTVADMEHGDVAYVAAGAYWVDYLNRLWIDGRAVLFEESELWDEIEENVENIEPIERTDKVRGEVAGFVAKKFFRLIYLEVKESGEVDDPLVSGHIIDVSHRNYTSNGSPAEKIIRSDSPRLISTTDQSHEPMEVIGWISNASQLEATEQIFRTRWSLEIGNSALSAMREMYAAANADASESS